MGFEPKLVQHRTGSNAKWCESGAGWLASPTCPAGRRRTGADPVGSESKVVWNRTGNQTGADSVQVGLRLKLDRLTGAEPVGSEPKLVRSRDRLGLMSVLT